jgi:DNA polymerase III alpha subunit
LRITGKLLRTKSGDPTAFLTFEDETGVVKTTFFPKTDDRFCHHIDHGRPHLPAAKWNRTGAPPPDRQPCARGVRLMAFAN